MHITDLVGKGKKTKLYFGMTCPHCLSRLKFVHPTTKVGKKNKNKKKKCSLMEQAEKENNYFMTLSHVSLKYK